MENMDVSPDILKSVKATIQIQFSTPSSVPTTSKERASQFVSVRGVWSWLSGMRKSERAEIGTQI